MTSLRKTPRNLWIVTITSFLTDISSEMIVYLIPLFLANVLKTGTAIVGLIEGIAETTASLMKLYSGALSDRLGKRKWLTVAGYALSTLAKPFLYFANTWQLVLGVRFTDRLGKGIRTAPRDALVAGSINEQQRGWAFGFHRAGDTLGAFIGLALAALIIYLTQSNSALLSQHTFQVAVLISIIPAALAVLVLAFGAVEIPIRRDEAFSNDNRPSPSQTSVNASPLHKPGIDRRFKIFLGIICLFTLGNSADAFIVLRAQERGLNVLQVMLMILLFNLVYAVLSGPLGSLSDRVGRRRLMFFGWITYGLVYLGLALAQAGWQVWVLYTLYGVYYAATEGTAKAFIADLVPDERRGTAYGLYNAAVGIMALPASLLAGLLWQGAFGWNGFGPAAPFFFGASLALLAGVLFWRYIK